MSTHDDAPPPARCANCGADLDTDRHAPRFCPACGQETRLHPPTLGEFVHEFASHYVALEGALWRTLGLLLFRPGRLTQEYLQGRRRRYVLPLRLYISASFMFFIVVKVLGLGTGPFIDMNIELPAAGTPQRAAFDACVVQGQGCGGFERWLGQRALRAGAQGLDNPGLEQKLLAMAPYAVFAMQPVFAGLVALAYRRRAATYGAHFVFSLHVHSLFFIGLLLIALLPETPGLVVMGAMVLYAVLALHRVYGGSAWRTALRGLVLGAVYAILLATLIGILTVLALGLG